MIQSELTPCAAGIHLWHRVGDTLRCFPSMAFPVLTTVGGRVLAFDVSLEEQCVRDGDVLCLAIQHFTEAERGEVVGKVRHGRADLSCREVHIWHTVHTLTWNVVLEQMKYMWPVCLRTLTFGGDFDQSLGDVTFPHGLQSLTYGEWFRQSLDNITLPDGLRSLTFGSGFNQSLDRATLPHGFWGLAFGHWFCQSLDDAILPGCLRILTCGDWLCQNLYSVLLLAGFIVRTLVA